MIIIIVNVPENTKFVQTNALLITSNDGCYDWVGSFEINAGFHTSTFGFGWR